MPIALLLSHSQPVKHPVGSPSVCPDTNLSNDSTQLHLAAGSMSSDVQLPVW